MSILGSGTYGCVYKSPGLLCGNKEIDERHKGKTLVTKLLLRRYMDPEVEAAAVLNVIDPYQQYTIYALLDTVCTPTVAQAETCKATQKDPQNAVMFKMHAGDLTYDFLLDNIDLYVYPQGELIFLWHAIHLFEALVKLHKAGLYHLDIKPNNVILTTFSNRTVLPRLIDFGISFDSKKHPTWNDALRRLARFIHKPYAIAPPENQALMSYKNDPDLINYKDWVNETSKVDPNYIPWLMYYDVNTSFAVIKEIINVDMKRINTNKDIQAVHNLFAANDVYTLSSLFLSGLTGSVSQIWRVLKDGINPDYRLRPTAEQMLRNLEAIPITRSEITSLARIPEIPNLPYLTRPYVGY